MYKTGIRTIFGFIKANDFIWSGVNITSLMRVELIL